MQLRDVPALGTFARNAPRYWLFDFQYFPEVLDGETLSGPVVDPVDGLTIGVPVVTSTTLSGVPAGKGVIVPVTAPVAGTYTLVCTVSFSGGGGETIEGTLSVE